MPRPSRTQIDLVRGLATGRESEDLLCIAIQLGLEPPRPRPMPTGTSVELSHGLLNLVQTVLSASRLLGLHADDPVYVRQIAHLLSEAGARSERLVA
jgi:hypothetical protein